MCQRNAGRAITGQAKTISTILAEKDIPTFATMARQLNSIATEKSICVADISPGREITTTKFRQHTRKSRRKTVSKALKTIFGTTQPERTTGLLPPWLQTGNPVLVEDGAKSGDAENDKVLELLKLA